MQTYGELRRRKRYKASVFEDTRPDINEPVNDRSPDNDREDMLEQSRYDSLRADIAVRNRKRGRRR